MLRRALPSVLAAAAALSELAGAGGLAHLILLAAVPAAAVVVLDAVSDRVVGRAGIPELVLAVLGLGFVLSAATLRAPLLALGVVIGSVPRAPQEAHSGRELAAWRARSMSG